jgi:hypothetical protein
VRVTATQRKHPLLPVASPRGKNAEKLRSVIFLQPGMMVYVQEAEVGG